jgi:hypothetical protein
MKYARGRIPGRYSVRIKTDLMQKVLSQAIGARQKFAGLRAW